MSLHDGNAGEAYFAIADSKLTESVLLVRTSRPPDELLPLAARLTRAIDPQLGPVVRPLSESFDEQVGDSKNVTAVISAMGVLALLLAIIGLYGVVSCNVAQRTKEIGIRIALGAGTSNVMHSVLARFLLPFGVALAAGLMLAGVLSFILRSYLYGVHHLDPLSYLGAAAILTGIGGLAALIPARRALKVDPMAALRCE